MRAPSRAASVRAARRVAIVRALPGLGDMLCLIPACRAIRAGLPDAEITLIGLPWARSFVTRFAAYVDTFVEFPGYPGIAEQPVAVRRLPAFLAAAQKQRYDLALQMHGSGGASNPFTILLGADRTAGFFERGAYCPDSALFLPWKPEESEVRRYLRLAAHLGFPEQGEALEFPVTPQDHAELRQLPEYPLLQASSYACIHPGAKDPVRRWPPERFAAVGDALARRGLRVVLTGTSAEHGLALAVQRAMAAPSLNLAGRTSLGALAALLEGAALLVCNDTGVSHLADALGVPSIAVFLAADPARWAPRDRRLHRVIDCREPDEDAGLPTALQEVADLLAHLDAASLAQLG